MSNGTDLRYVLVDIEDMNDGDLVQFMDGHFQKFQPLGEWLEGNLPANVGNIEEVFAGSGFAPYGFRPDGLKGVSVRGVIACLGETFMALQNPGSKMFVLDEDLAEELRPSANTIVVACIFIMKTSALVGDEYRGGSYPAMFHVMSNGAVAIQTLLGPDVEAAIDSDEYFVIINLNGHYDTLA